MSTVKNGIPGAEIEAAPDTAHTEPLSAGRVLLITAGVALTAGAVELAIGLVRKLVFGHVLRVSRDVVWMAPLGEVLLLLPPLAAVWAAGMLWPRLRAARALLFVLLFTALCSILLFTGFLHDAAIVILAAGGAWRLAQLASARGPRLVRSLRTLVPVLSAMFVLFGIAVHASASLRERSILAALPPATAGAPNVILIIWDTVRAASLGLYGHDRPTTPNLERLARRGVIFDRAISTTSWTLPSHVSMLTGALPHETSATWHRPFDGSHRSIAEVLADRGYATGAFAANVLYIQWENGIDDGFARFEDYRITPGQVFLSTALGRRIATGRHGWGTGLLFRLADYTEFLGRKRADDVNRAFVDWLDDRGERPFFAMLNYYDAHLPYLPPEPFAGRFGRPRANTTLFERARREWAGREYWDKSPAGIEAEVAAYEESIAYLDDRLGALMEELERRGELENTIVIVTSDHGEEFGEHGDFEHGTNVYMEQTHVPLVVVQPNAVPSGVRVGDPVSIRDIPATIADLAGLSDTVSFPGASLASTWTGRSVARSPAFAELTPGLRPDQLMCAAVDRRYHLVRNPDRSVELYDWVADPREASDLASAPDLADAMTRLARAMESRTGCTDL